MVRKTKSGVENVGQTVEGSIGGVSSDLSDSVSDNAVGRGDDSLLLPASSVSGSVYLSLIHLRGRPYLLNSDGEVFAIELRGQFVMPIPCITKQLDGDWVTTPDAKIRITPPIRRELNRRWRELLVRWRG